MNESDMSKECENLAAAIQERIDLSGDDLALVPSEPRVQKGPHSHLGTITPRLDMEGKQIEKEEPLSEKGLGPILDLLQEKLVKPRVDPGVTLLAQIAATRVDIGSFRRTKPNTREMDYCTCYFELWPVQRLQEQEQEQEQAYENEHEQQTRRMEFREEEEKKNARDVVKTGAQSNTVALWITLAHGEPALRVGQSWIESVVYTTSTRQLRIVLRSKSRPLPGPLDMGTAEGKPSWRQGYQSNIECKDPTDGGLVKSGSIILWLSRLVDTSVVQGLVERIMNHPTEATGGSNDIPPLEKPVLVTSISQLSLSSTSTLSPCTRAISLSPNSSSPTWSLSPSGTEATLWSARDTMEFDLYSKDLDQAVKSGQDHIDKGDSYSVHSLADYLSLEKTDKEIQNVPQRHRNSSEEFVQKYSAHTSPSSEHVCYGSHHRKRCQCGRHNFDASSQEQTEDQSTGVSKTSKPRSKSRGRPLEDTDGLLLFQHVHPNISESMVDKQVTSEDSQNPETHKVSTSPVQLHNQRSSLAVSTAFDYQNWFLGEHKESAADTELIPGQSDNESTDQCNSMNDDHRMSISSSSTYSCDDSSTSSFSRSMTPSTSSPSMSSASSNHGDNSSRGSSISGVLRKGGPPVHYTLMCWIGGRWPCKLRPLIKKTNLDDILAMLRRNLKLPKRFYIDIEFDHHGNTFMILNTSHWQWAREQMNHGDMSIRCKIWQKHYTR